MSAALAEAPPIPGRTDLTKRWFTEHLSAHEVHSHALRKTLVKTRTPFQQAALVDSYTFGRCLILDDELQSAQLDEFIYHECLVHPAMTLHPRPRRILVLGGGEGATVREILRHPQVQTVTMVDIDGAVVEFCREHLASWHAGALDHPKTRLIIGDARTFVEQTREKFDVILSDLPTPTTGSPTTKLYTAEFYRLLRKRLAPGGLFVTQAGSGSLVQLSFHAALFQTLAKIFSRVRPYYAFIPSFDVPWAFLIASPGADPRALTARAVDGRLGTLRRTLRFYDGEAHVGLFHIPKYLRDALRSMKTPASLRK